MDTPSAFDNFIKETCHHFISSMFNITIDDKELDKQFIPYIKLYIIEEKEENCRALSDEKGNNVAYMRIGVSKKIKAIFRSELGKHRANSIVEAKLMYDTILQQPCYLVGNEIKYSEDHDPDRWNNYMKEFLKNFPLSAEQIEEQIK